MARRGKFGVTGSRPDVERGSEVGRREMGKTSIGIGSEEGDSRVGMGGGNDWRWGEWGWRKRRDGKARRENGEGLHLGIWEQGVGMRGWGREGRPGKLEEGVRT